MSNMNSAAHGTPVEDEGPTGEPFLSWSILDELNLSFLMEAMPEMIGAPIKVRLDASPRADILVTREATSPQTKIYATDQKNTLDEGCEPARAARPGTPTGQIEGGAASPSPVPSMADILRPLFSVVDPEALPKPANDVAMPANRFSLVPVPPAADADNPPLRESDEPAQVPACVVTQVYPLSPAHGTGVDEFKAFEATHVPVCVDVVSRRASITTLQAVHAMRACHPSYGIGIGWIFPKVDEAPEADEMDEVTLRRLMPIARTLSLLEGQNMPEDTFLREAWILENRYQDHVPFSDLIGDVIESHEL